MRVIKLFLLAGYLSIANADKTMETIQAVVEKHMEKEFTLQSGKCLTLLDTKLGETGKSLIQKGLFDGVEVAVKFFMKVECIKKEKAAYKALESGKTNAVGIPVIYYAGRFEMIPVIVMTLFHESLYQRWFDANRIIDMNIILDVFLQSVKTLKYMREKRVVHNDIKPQNIFFRGDKVFIGDFDLATLNDEMSLDCTIRFVSSRYWDHKLSLDIFEEMKPFVRTAMEDLESLVYSMWSIAGMNSRNGHGHAISQEKTPQAKIAYVTNKCDQFSSNPVVRNACLLICKDQILSVKSVPDYDVIIYLLTNALSAAERTMTSAHASSEPASPSSKKSISGLLKKTLSFKNK